MSLHRLLLFSFELILIFLFFSLLPLLPLTVFIPWQYMHLNAHTIPSPPLLCFSLCFAFFLHCLTSSLPVPYIFLPDYVILYSMNHTFRSEIAKDLEEWGKLDHWRVSVLLPGHMVFHSVWKFECFCPVVLSMWEYQAFQTLNWGLRFITVTLSTYFCPVRVIILEEMNKQGEQNKQISASLGWACWDHPWGLHREDKFPLLI